MNRLLALCILTALAAPLARAQEAREPTDLTDALHLAEVWLDSQQDFYDLPGLAAAVVRDQEVVWAGAFGHVDVEVGVPLTLETQFHIASISKTFCAVAVMTLVEDGKLRLDDRVADLLPWFNPPPRARDNGPITVRRLLTHSAGLTREIETPFWDDFNSAPRSDALRDEFSAETLYPSETVFQYSNLAFMLLGELVAEVSGMPYMDYLQDRVLRPIGLDRTVAGYSEAAYGTAHAVGYKAPGRDRRYTRVDYNPPERIAPMGGLSSTVLDLARYASWQLRLHDEDAEPEVLRPSTLRSMHRVHFTDADWETTWGLGFAVSKGPEGSTLVSHGGSLPGHRSHFLLHPSTKMAYVVAINTSGENPNLYTKTLMSLVAKAKAIPDDAERRLPRERLVEYDGAYVVNGQDEVAIVPWEGRLAIVFLPTAKPAEDMRVFEHVEGDSFHRVRDDGDYGETLTFTRDAEGDIQSARIFNYIIKRLDR